jgi:demethoxyubiquinone hydroxylase (CLK1/Coq7/Cat5 family)
MPNAVSDVEREKLIGVLRAAYAGELAAAHAYAGHATSLSDPHERSELLRIEREEWEHREIVGKMLAELSTKPSKFRDAVMGAMGRVIGVLCHVTGWFMPMYVAGRIEEKNVEEYKTAARHATAMGWPEASRQLLELADIEKTHEVFFMGAVRDHRSRRSQT